MIASTTYHTFGIMSQKIFDRLLNVDLMGIGIMITGLTLVAVYLGFHNWPTERIIIMYGMAIIMILNLVL